MGRFLRGALIVRAGKAPSLRLCQWQRDARLSPPHREWARNGCTLRAHGPQLRLGALRGRQGTPKPDTHRSISSGSQWLEYPQPSHESCPRSPFHSSRSPPTDSYTGQAMEGAIRARVAVLQFLPGVGRPSRTSASPVSQPYLGPPRPACDVVLASCAKAPSCSSPNQGLARGEARAALTDGSQGHKP